MNYNTIMQQTPQQVTLPSTMPAIQSFIPGAALQTCVVDVMNDLWCWGPNDFGEVGDGTTKAVTTPTLVHGGPWGLASLGGNDQWTEGAHTCALDRTGTLFGWGSDSLDQLGISNTSVVVSPSAVPPEAGWKEIGTGTSFTCGIRADGTVWCWGHSFDPNTAQLTTVPWQISSQTDWHGLAAGASWACALRGDNSAWCWGYGALGSTGAPISSNSPVKVAATTPWSSLSIGLTQACGLDDHGHLWCWGSNASGEVGNGTINEAAQPTPVP
jgi:alpha-tubulin suppressor-like RCC1 family protein